MLSRLSINHFKSVESADIELGNVTVFVGNNGSGKTNVVDALRFLKDATQNGLDRAFSDRHGVDSVRQWSPTRPYIISLGVVIESNNFWAKYRVTISSAKGLFQVEKEEGDIRSRQETAFYREDDDSEDLAAVDQRIFFLRRKDGSLSQEVWSSTRASAEAVKFDPIDLSIWRSVEPEKTDEKVAHRDELLLYSQGWKYGPLRQMIANFQAYSIFPNTLRQPQEPSNDSYLAPEGRNLASVFKRMRKTRRGLDAINQITEAMRLILPTLDKISILSLGGFLVPQFHMVEPSGSRHSFNISQMSDGTLRVLGLLTALYQEPRPPIIALEEPEQTVNPGVLTILADSLKEISQRSQVIITTHSPNLLDKFDPSLIRTVDLSGGKTRVGRVSLTQVRAVQDRLFTLGELLVAEGLHDL